MQTLIFSSQQPSKAKGFSLMELLIYLALAAVFIGGVLTLTGKAGADSEIRQAVQDISDIDNAMRAYYGAQRIATASAPTAVQMEAVAANQVERMANGAAVITQFGTDIHIGSSRVTGDYSWPNYWIEYTGMRTETCAGVLGSLTGPISVDLIPGSATTAITAWALAVGTDDRATALGSATNVEAFCIGATGAGTGETFTVRAIYRI